MSKIKTGNPSSIRKLNRQIVLNLIMKKNIISKIELSQLSGLKPPTISNIFNQLIEEKLIVFHSKGEPNSNGGPKPDLYRLNYTSRYFIGIDINMKGIIGVLMDLGGNVAGTLTMPFDMDDQAQLSGTLISLIDKLLESNEVSPSILECISIGLVGLVDTDRGVIVDSDIRALKNFRIKEILTKRYPVKIYIDNDINLLVSSQNEIIGNYDNLNALCFGIRTGIGLGIMINGKIYRGDSGMAGNLNRHFFHTDSQYTFCSDEYILEAVQKAGKDLSIGKNSEVDMSSLFCLLEQADIDLIEALESALHPLAELIGKLISIFNPFYVFVCGEVLSHSTELFDRIVKNSGKYCSDKVYQNVKFLRILLDDISIAKSAARYAINEFCNVRNAYDE